MNAFDLTRMFRTASVAAAAADVAIATVHVMN